MARLTRTSDPQGALKHLDAALESDPHLVDAVQLRALMRARLGDRAMLDDVDFLVKAPTAQRLYNAACALAVYAETARTRAWWSGRFSFSSLRSRQAFPPGSPWQTPI